MKFNTLHCILCNTCIPYWDHHCFWLNTCIHEKNKSTFKLFFYVIIASVVLEFVFFLFSNFIIT